MPSLLARHNLDLSGEPHTAKIFEEVGWGPTDHGIVEVHRPTLLWGVGLHAKRTRERFDEGFGRFANEAAVAVARIRCARRYLRPSGDGTERSCQRCVSSKMFKDVSIFPLKISPSFKDVQRYYGAQRGEDCLRMLIRVMGQKVEYRQFVALLDQDNPSNSCNSPWPNQHGLTLYLTLPRLEVSFNPIKCKCLEPVLQDTACALAKALGHCDCDALLTFIGTFGVGGFWLLSLQSTTWMFWPSLSLH